MSLIKSYPRSAAQLAANRLNGRKSRGPVTPEGKRNSSANSLRHGLYAVSPVIKGESPAAFARLLADLHATYSPSGAAEQLCVYHIAAAQWKLLRATQIEVELINREIDQLTTVNPSPSLRPALALEALQSRPLNLAALREIHSSLEVTIERHLRHLFALQALCPANAVAGNDPTNSLDPQHLLETQPVPDAA